MGHVGVGLLAAAADSLLLLRLGRRDYLTGLAGGRQADVEQGVAQVVWIGGNGDLVPGIHELRVHGVHERCIVVPDGLGDAVLCALDEHLLLVLHGLDVVGDGGPAVLQVLDGQALGGLLVLQVALELGRVADVELGLVAVRLVAGVPRNAIAGVVGAHEGPQLLALDMAGRDVEEAHDVVKGHPLAGPAAQVVGGIGEARVDMLARARVLRLRVDDGRRSLCWPLALCAVGRRVGGRGRGRVDARGRVCLEEGHGGSGAGRCAASS